jgi:predicted molibdopterin-dependent oxidoreductase YjgC
MGDARSDTKRSDIAGVGRGRQVRLEVNGQPIRAWEGESVSAALLRAGFLGTRNTPKRGQLRGYYCGMGVCFECMVDIENIGMQRGCQTPVTEGMSVRVPKGEE